MTDRAAVDGPEDLVARYEEMRAVAIARRCGPGRAGHRPVGLARDAGVDTRLAGVRCLPPVRPTHQPGQPPCPIWSVCSQPWPWHAVREGR